MYPPGSSWTAAALPAVLISVLAGASMVAGATAAIAHTELESADPEPDAQVDDLERITLVYQGPLSEGGDHEIGLFDADARIETSATQMLDARTVAVDVAGPVPAAELTVRWVIVAGDGDEQRGEYSFTLTESVVVTQTSPTPDETASASPGRGRSTAEPSPTTEAVGEVTSEAPAGRGRPAGALAAAGLTAAVAVGGVILAIRRRG